MSHPVKKYNDICEVHREVREMQKFGLTEDGKVALRTLTEISFASVDDTASITIDVVPSNTEVAFVLPDGIKKLIIRSRKITRLRISWEAGETANDGNYISVPLGGVYTKDGINTENKTIYIRSNKSNTKLEVEAWS